MKRAELGTHEQSCPLITIGPYFEAQNSRLDSMELTVRHLQQRNEILDDGLASVRSTLVESSRAFSAQHNSQHSDNTSSPAMSELSDANTRIPSTDPDTTTNATTYLLSLHESLREEVAQMSHAITDLDARASMAIMNECLRLKEDMAHTNAAVNSIRMQVGWLMNPRLHQGQRTQNGSDSTTAAGTSAGVGPSNSPGLLRPRRSSDTGREGTKL